MRALAWLLAWLVCLIVAVWALIALPLSVVFGSGRRGWRLAVSYDRLGNTAAGGDGLETFSARCWRNRDRLLYGHLVIFIDWLFLRIDGEVDHCMSAWEKEEAARLESCLT